MLNKTTAALAALAVVALSGCVALPPASSLPSAAAEQPTVDPVEVVVESPEPVVEEAEPTQEPAPEPVAAPGGTEQSFLDLVDPVLAAEFGVPVSLMRSMPEYDPMADSVLEFGYSTCGLDLDTVRYVYDTTAMDMSWTVVQVVHAAAATELC